MLRITTLASASLAVAAPIFAQQVQMGVLNHIETSLTSRGGVAGNNAQAILFNRIDKDAYAGWGYDSTQYPIGNRVLHGVYVVNQDQVDTTAETFGVAIYYEDVTPPALPHFPDIPLGVTAGPFNYPLGTTGGASAFAWTLTFLTPVTVPVQADVFIGQDLSMSPGGTWPTNGLSVHLLSYTQPIGFSGWDAPGFGHPTSPPEQAGNAGLFVPSTATLAYLNPSQALNEPLLGASTGAVGAAATITNQPNAPNSHVAPGTSSMASGLFPDARNAPLNLGRADDIAERWSKTGTPPGDLVLFLRSFGGFGTELPMALVDPAWQGLICVDVNSLDVYAFSVTSAGEAWAITSLPPGPGIRSQLAGVTIVQQAVCIHAATGAWETNFCTKQTL